MTSLLRFQFYRNNYYIRRSLSSAVRFPWSFSIVSPVVCYIRIVPLAQPFQDGELVTMTTTWDSVCLCLVTWCIIVTSWRRNCFQASLMQESIEPVKNTKNVPTGTHYFVEVENN